MSESLIEMSHPNSGRNSQDPEPTVASLAHDVSNLLLVVNWGSQQLQSQLGPDHPHQNAVAAIHDAGAQATQLMRRLQRLVTGETVSADAAEVCSTQDQGCGSSNIMASGETILLVEDDAAILELVRRRLESHGYKVLSAQTGAVAIALAQDYSDAIHLLVTDLSLPEQSGREIAETLRELYPDLPALFLSGQSLDPHMSTLNGDGNSFLQKPFKSNDLLARVRDMIHHRA